MRSSPSRLSPLLALPAFACSPFGDADPIAALALDGRVSSGGDEVVFEFSVTLSETSEANCEELEVDLGIDDDEGTSLPAFWTESSAWVGLGRDLVPTGGTGGVSCDLSSYSVDLDEVGGGSHTVWVDSGYARYAYTAYFPRAEYLAIHTRGPFAFIGDEPLELDLDGVVIDDVTSASSDDDIDFEWRAYDALQRCDVDADVEDDRLTLRIEPGCRDERACDTLCEGELDMDIAVSLVEEECSGFSSCEADGTLEGPDYYGTEDGFDATWAP